MDNGLDIYFPNMGKRGRGYSTPKGGNQSKYLEKNVFRSSDISIKSPRKILLKYPPLRCPYLVENMKI